MINTQYNYFYRYLRNKKSNSPEYLRDVVADAKCSFPRYPTLSLLKTKEKKNTENFIKYKGYSCLQYSGKVHSLDLSWSVYG